MRYHEKRSAIFVCSCLITLATQLPVVTSILDLMPRNCKALVAHRTNAISKYLYIMIIPLADIKHCPDHGLCRCVTVSSQSGSVQADQFLPGALRARPTGQI
jgi:hypothetical protein